MSEEYVCLAEHPDYEIGRFYPYPIREADTKRVIKEIPKGSHLVVKIDGRYHLKHILIAEQFVPNDDPEKKFIVDFKNGNLYDDSIENLIWVKHP